MAQLQNMRTVTRFDDTGFVRMHMKDLPDEQVWWKNVSFDEDTGQGSYLMKMAPGTRSNPHIHHGREEFFVLEGDLTDHDGFSYRSGDFVSLAAGSSHFSRTEAGCLLVVIHRGATESIQEGAL
ncbi:anti-sigma factor, putative, ChrR family [Ruegeria denitrificans]|uniref:Anti-sigma factor, putative, ChrR family n=1 Tax=Ruegeria denitrificans TaxID=1715692 RepID=A0A0P1IKX7_9RHOB|nr:cupin domain-containing protein [Ruegeria denitrificans]CUK20427.1 anti-sigma factor, putative, ChrR family [Ruegeria denitrificans]